MTTDFTTSDGTNTVNVDALAIGGTTITSTPAELNALDGITATVAELNTLDGGPAGATIVVGTEATNVINVTVQLTDGNGADLAVRGAVMFYLSDDANGDSHSGTAPSGGIAIGTDGVCIEWAANTAGMLISESDGDIDIDITDTGTPTFYLILVMPNGKLVASGAITFA